MLIMLSGIRMNGTTVVGESLDFPQLPLRRSELLFPAVSIETYGTKKDYCRALKPIFDTIWNAAGCPNSPSYGLAANGHNFFCEGLLRGPTA
jgi:hypothetical protein